MAVSTGNLEIFGLNTGSIHFSAIFAASWLVLETFAREKFLLAGRPGEILTAFFALENFVLKFHSLVFYQQPVKMTIPDHFQA